MMKTRSENAEVLYPEEDVVLVGKADIDELKSLAVLNPRRRVRLCTHRAPSDRLHEMLIVHMRGCWVRPHKHIDKAESMSIIEGEVDIVLFHDDGSVREVISMGPAGSGRVFYQRLSAAVYHTLLIRSEILVFHESTEGPFIRERTVFPAWAPADEGPATRQYLERLEATIQARSTNA